MHQAHIFISGFVQGVGFRQFVRREAGKLGILGWVKNTKDGRVEALFHGQKEKIKEIILLCRKGPILAEVENVEVLWEDSKDTCTDFQILM